MASFIGLGVGPGDPELITLKSIRLLQEADIVTFICNTEGYSQALDIARQALQLLGLTLEEAKLLAIPFRMTRERDEANQAYDHAADKIARYLDEDRSVVFLCEGDPLFFGSFAYLQERLSGRYHCEAVSGISSPQAASAALGVPLALLAENLCVLSGRHNEPELISHFRDFDNAVVLKAGRSRPQILRALKASGRYQDALYIEYATRAEQRIVTDLDKLEPIPGPYFSLFLVSRHKNLVNRKGNS
ncbi:MAG: precorrin-2 C(20)-methyltransferase [Pseudomonadales bacterium]|uniref:Precorrin-2 methyltransferase n=1 Tax=Oleiphilus messinensis TaxID=141451 RepID=A0A1Y0I8H6_9GAMM|nr:precorrin-2 C(20)-methyltransferase [Oleiphilus messinensis]ARU56807.1 precorrin-2 methyltransferase [Oleiphilus messinensis]MCG8610776.1 precorrin-2 C(20)-methyltransferase [Pseudomonadales bacterium]